MKLKKLWQKYKEHTHKNSEEGIEEEEFEKFIAKVEKRMDKILAAQKATTHEGRAQVALMFENAYTQKKLSDVNDSLRNATWILAFATGLFAWTALLESPYKDYMVGTIGNIVGIVLLIGISLGIINLIWKMIIKIIKFVWKKK